MDQLTARKILQVSRDSSQEEIRQAYARLSRQFHPEEHPDEFQQIQEAYRTLRVRTSHRRQQKASPGEEQFQKPVHEDTMESTEEAVFLNPAYEDVSEEENNSKSTGTDECKISKEEKDQRPVYEEPLEEEWEEESTGYSETDFIPNETTLKDEWEEAENTENGSVHRFDFESVIQQAEQEEGRQELRTVEKALLKMELLLLPEHRNKLKLFQKFFEDEEYQPVLTTPEFADGFAKLLSDVTLKNSIYDYIIDRYRFRSTPAESLSPEARRLYQVLVQKRGAEKKKRDKLLYGIPAIAAVALRATVRSRSNLASVNVLITLLIVFLCCTFVYRWLYKNHSNLFAQGMTAFLLIISQIVVLFGNFYARFLSQESADLLGVTLAGGATFWLSVVIIVGVVKKIVSIIRKHTEKHK